MACHSFYRENAVPGIFFSVKRRASARVRAAEVIPSRDDQCMLIIVAIILLVLWGGGLAFRVAGGLIHVLLVIALIVFVLHFVLGRGM
jgi:hypothetical protein